MANKRERDTMLQEPLKQTPEWSRKYIIVQQMRSMCFQNRAAI